MPKAKPPKKSLKVQAVRAALELSATQGWANTSLDDIALKCKCTLAELTAIFKDRTAILVGYADHLDRTVAERVTIDGESSERDRLFDVMMERFDILNEDRAAILSIAASLRTDPKTALSGLPHLGQSMIAMLDAARIDAAGPCGTLTALGLTGVYLYTLKAWMEDESGDMPRTMATLDRALGQAESLVGLVSRFI